MIFFKQEEYSKYKIGRRNTLKSRKTLKFEFQKFSVISNVWFNSDFRRFLTICLSVYNSLYQILVNLI